MLSLSRRIPRIPRIPALPLVALGLLAAAGPACASDAKHKRTAELTVSHQSQSGLHIEAENGAIEVTADPDATTVTIIAEIRAQTPERAEAVTIQAERRADGVLSIAAIWPEDELRNNEGCSFEIIVPDANGVHATTGNGAIEINGLGGLAELHTSNGAIDVYAHQGPIEADTSNGAIDIDESAGSVDAKTSNGRIELNRVAGPVNAKTSNGSVSVGLAPGGVGPVNIKTSNGAIDFEFAPGFVGTLIMSTSMGKIEFTDATGRTVTQRENFEIEIGSGGPECVLHTSMGSISVSVEDED